MEPTEFIEKVLKAHKQVASDAWAKWQEMVEEDKKRADSLLMKKYPDGFKDFLMEFLDILIDENEGKEPAV